MQHNQRHTALIHCILHQTHTDVVDIHRMIAVMLHCIVQSIECSMHAFYQQFIQNRQNNTKPCFLYLHICIYIHPYLYYVLSLLLLVILGLASSQCMISKSHFFLFGIFFCVCFFVTRRTHLCESNAQPNVNSDDGNTSLSLAPSLSVLISIHNSMNSSWRNSFETKKK